MKRLHHPLLALLLAVLLAALQPVAFAHLLGHTPGKSAATVGYQHEHASFDGVAETCATCIALAGTAAALPSTMRETAADALPPDLATPRLPQPFAQPLVGPPVRAPPTFL